MIGLATGHTVYNYGTRLQAYAMQNIMEKRGYKCEIIYYGKSNESGLKSYLRQMLIHLLPGYSKRYFTSLQENNRIGQLKTYLDKCSFDHPDEIERIKNNINSRFEVFDNFNNKHLKINFIIGNKEFLRNVSERYNAVFCGSDQAWLPANIKNDFYTLSFTSDHVRRISYAPSFGVSDVPVEMEYNYKKFLRRMDFISVREDRGRELVKDLTGKEVPVVLDPTLLLDSTFWNSVRKQVNKEYLPNNYVLCYFLGTSADQRLEARKFATEQELPIVSLVHMKQYVDADENTADFKLYDVDPLEFVTLVRNAKFVFTDSFHCVSFSVQFRRTFYVFHRFKENDIHSTNSRIDSLLEQLGLEKQIVKEEKASYNIDIDYMDVDIRLGKLRDVSNSYLDTALRGLNYD